MISFKRKVLFVKVIVKKQKQNTNCICNNLSKNTHRKNTPSNKTQAVTKSMNMDLWVFGILNQLFITGSYNQTKFSKK